MMSNSIKLESILNDERLYLVNVEATTSSSLGTR